MGANQVDVLRFMDFCNYILAIDAYHEAKKKQAEMEAQG